MTRDIAIQSFVYHPKRQPLANCVFSPKAILTELKVEGNNTQSIYKSLIMEQLNSTCTVEVQSGNLVSQICKTRDMKTGDCATHLLLEDVCNDFENIDVSSFKKKPSINVVLESKSSGNGIIQDNELADAVHIVSQNEELPNQEQQESANTRCATELQDSLLSTVDSSLASEKTDENALNNVYLTDEKQGSAPLAELSDAELIQSGDNSISLVISNTRSIRVNTEQICLDEHLTTGSCSAVVELTSEHCSTNNEDSEVLETTDNSGMQNVAFVGSGSGNDCEKVSEIVCEEVAEVVPQCEVPPEKQKLTNSLRVKNKLTSSAKTSHALGFRKNIRARRITLKMKSEWVSELASVGFLTCPMPGCSQTYKALANFQTHYKYCTGKKNLQHCPYCDSLIFSSQHAILHHMNVEHPDKLTEYAEKCNIDVSEMLPSSSEENSVEPPKNLKSQHVSKSYKRKVVYKENMSSAPPQKRILKHKMKKIKETVMQNIQDFKKCVRFNDIVHKINSISDVTKAAVFQNATPDIKFFKSRKRRIVIPEEIVEEQKYFSDADDLSSSDALDINSSFESEILDSSGRINTKSRLVLDLQRYKRYNEYLKLTRDWSSDRKTYSRSRSLDSSFNSPLPSSLELGLQDIHQLSDCTDSIEMSNNNASEDEVLKDGIVTDIPVFENLESLCIDDKELSIARRNESNKHIKRVIPKHFAVSFSATLENLATFPTRPTRVRTTCYDGAAHSNEKEISTPRKLTNDNPIMYGLKVPTINEPRDTKKNFDSLLNNSHTSSNFPINEVVKLTRKRGRPKSTETKIMKRMCKENSNTFLTHTGPIKTKCKYYKEDGVKLPCEIFVNPDTVKKKRGRPRKHPLIIKNDIFDVQNSKKSTEKYRFSRKNATPPVSKFAPMYAHLGKNNFKQSINSRVLHSFHTKSRSGKKSYFAKRRLVALNKLVSSMTNKYQQKKFLQKRYKSTMLKNKIIKRINNKEARTKNEVALKMRAKRGRPMKQKLPKIVVQSNFIHDSMSTIDETICTEKNNLEKTIDESEKTSVEGENGEIVLQNTTENEESIRPDVHPTDQLGSGFTPDLNLQNPISSKPEVTANEENFVALDNNQNQALITRILGTSDVYTEVLIAEEVVTEPLSVVNEKTDKITSQLSLINTDFQNCETLPCDIDSKVHNKGFDFKSSKNINSMDHNYTLNETQNTVEIKNCISTCVNKIPFVVKDNVERINQQSNVLEIQSAVSSAAMPLKRGRGRPKKYTTSDTNKESVKDDKLKRTSQSPKSIPNCVSDPSVTAETNEKPARVLRKSVRVNKKMSTEDFFFLPKESTPIKEQEIQNDKASINMDISTPIRRKRGRPRKYPTKHEGELKIMNNLNENFEEDSLLKKCSHMRKGRPQKCVRFADLNSGIDSSESHDEVPFTTDKKKTGPCKTAQENDEECVASGVEGGLILPLKKRKTSNVQINDPENQISISTDTAKTDTDTAVSKITQMGKKIVHQKPKTKSLFFIERELKRGVTRDLKIINEKSAKSFQDKSKSNITICDDRKKSSDVHERNCLNQFTNASFKPSLKMCSQTAKNKIKNKLIQKLIKEHVKRKKKSNSYFEIGKKIASGRERAIDYMLTYSKKYEYKNLFQNLMPQAFMWKLLHGQDFIDYQPPLNDSAMIKIIHSKTNSETDWFSLKCFESAPYDASSGHRTFFTGGPVWSSAFCPTPLNIKTTQHIMIATSNAVNECHTFQSGNESGLLQLWDVGHLDSTSSLETCTPKLKFCISHNHGVISSMDWCPSGCWDDPSTQLSNNKDFLPRLGLLAVACSDAFIRIYSIPQPNGLQLDSVVLPLFCSWPVILLRPLFGGPSKLTLKTKAVTVCWEKNNGCECIAAGYGNGMVFIWRVSMSTTILTKNADVQRTFHPFVAFDAHGTPVTGLSFCPFLENHLVTSGLDTTLKFWNIKDTSIPLFSFNKGGAHCNQCSAQWCGAFVALDDGLSAIRSTAYKDCGIRQNSQRCLSNHNSCVWMCSLSDWLNMQAVADSSGEVTTSLAKSLQIEHIKMVHEKRYPVYRTEIRSLPHAKRKPTVILKKGYILDEADRLAQSTLSDLLNVFDVLDSTVESCLKLTEIEAVVHNLIDSTERITQNNEVLHDVSIFVKDLIESVDKKSDEENKGEDFLLSNLQPCDKLVNVPSCCNNTSSSQVITPEETHSEATLPTTISPMDSLNDSLASELNLVNKRQGEEYDNDGSETDILSFKESTSNTKLVEKSNLASELEVTEGSSSTIAFSDKVDKILTSEYPLENSTRDKEDNILACKSVISSLQDSKMENLNSAPLSSNTLSTVILNKRNSDGINCDYISDDNSECTHTNPETCECVFSGNDNFDCPLKSKDDYDSTQKSKDDYDSTQKSKDDYDNTQKSKDDYDNTQKSKDDYDNTQKSRVNCDCTQVSGDDCDCALQKEKDNNYMQNGENNCECSTKSKNTCVCIPTSEDNSGFRERSNSKSQRNFINTVSDDSDSLLCDNSMCFNSENSESINWEHSYNLTSNNTCHFNRDTVVIVNGENSDTNKNNSSSISICIEIVSSNPNLNQNSSIINDSGDMLPSASRLQSWIEQSNDPEFSTPSNFDCAPMLQPTNESDVKTERIYELSEDFSDSECTDPDLCTDPECSCKEMDCDDEEDTLSHSSFSHSPVKSVHVGTDPAQDIVGTEKMCAKNSSEPMKAIPENILSNHLTKYEDLSNNLGIVFKEFDLRDIHNIEESELQRLLDTDKMSSLPDDYYKLSSVNTVCWNPNFGSHFWLFTAGQSGIAHLSCASGLENATDRKKCVNDKSCL